MNISSTGSSWVHDFSASYFLKDDFEIYGGINNVFDREPFLGSFARPVGPRGRFFFLGVTYTQ